MKHHRELGKVFEIDTENMMGRNKDKDYCQCGEYLKSIASEASPLWFRFVFCPCCFTYWAFGPGMRTMSFSARVFTGQKDSIVRDILSESMKMATAGLRQF